MSASKEVFLRNKDLAAKWNAWTQSQDGAEVFAFADAELLAVPDLNTDMIRGAKNYRRILEQLSESDEAPPEYPTSGLDHDLDLKPRTSKTK